MSVRELSARRFEIEQRAYVPVAVTIGGNLYISQTTPETGVTDQIILGPDGARDLLDLLSEHLT